MSAISKKEEEKNEKLIRALLKLPENRKCVNCASVGPQSLCMNFSTFICTPCSGVHREFSHRIKSISMSKFTKEDAAALEDGGNQKAREVYLRAFDLAGMELPDNSNVRKLRDFIRAVYVEQRYTGEKPLPPLEVSQEPSPRSSIELPSRGRILGFGRSDTSDRNDRSSSSRISQDRYSGSSVRDSQEVPRGVRDSQDQSKGVRDSQDRARGVRDSQDRPRGVRDSLDRFRGVRDSQERPRGVGDSQDRGRAEQSVRDSQEGSSGGVEKERRSRGGFGSSLFTNMDRDRRAKAESKEADRARRQATMTAPRVGRGDTSGAEFRDSQELPLERSKVGAEAVDRPRRRVEEDTPPLRPLSDVLGPDVHVTVKGRGSDLNGSSVDDSASQGSVTRDSSQASVPLPRMLFPPGKDSVAADTPDSKASGGKIQLSTEQPFSLIDFSSESPSAPTPQNPSDSLGIDPFGLQDSLGGPPPQAAPPQPPLQTTSSAPAWSAFEAGAPPAAWGPPPTLPQPPAGAQPPWVAENQFLGQPGLNHWQPPPPQGPSQQPYPIPLQPLPHLSYPPPPQQPSYMQPPSQQPYQPPPPPVPWGLPGGSVPVPPFPPQGPPPPSLGLIQGDSYPPSAGPPPVGQDPATLSNPPMPAVVQPKVAAGPRKEIPQDLFSFSDPYGAPDSMKYPQSSNQQQLPLPGGGYGAPNPPIPGQPTPYGMQYTPLVTDQPVSADQPGAMPSYAQPPKSSNPFDEDEEPSAAADYPAAMAYPPAQLADQAYAGQPPWSGPATYPGGFPGGPGFYPPDQQGPPFAAYPVPPQPYDNQTYSRPYPGPASTGSFLSRPGAAPLDMASPGPASTGGYHPGHPVDSYGESEAPPRAESGPVDPFANLGLAFGTALPPQSRPDPTHPTAESRAANLLGL